MTTQLMTVAAEDAAACGHATVLGHRWWVLRDRTYNALLPVRRFLFRRYYQLHELQGEVMELQRDLEVALEISAEHMHATVRILEKLATLAEPDHQAARK
jgi:hypothetical protein